ncbi:MAG: lipopolysaccharide heptosyltransferase II [Gammaproteobacteria bacterium]
MVNLPQTGGIARILIIKWSAMGDVVIATAAMEDVVRAFPSSRIDLNAMRPWDTLFEHDPRFDEVFSFDLRGTERGLAGMWRWVRHVRERRYDLIVDLQSSDRTRALIAMLQLTGRGARYRMGHRRGFPYNVSPDWQDPGAASHENVRRTLAAGGIAARTERPVLHIPDTTSARVEALNAQHGLARGNYAVFLPGSQAAGHLKRWGATRYADLAVRLREDGLEHVVLLGGPDEVDECARIEAACGPWLVNLCGKTELFDLLPICEDARVIVGNDTGTAHIASTTTRPMVVVCGPTDPNRVKPMGSNVTTLQTSGLDCINCYCKQPCVHHSCMVQMTPATVHRAVQRRL